MRSTVDHLVFGSSRLEDGVEFIYERLGVRPEQGGQHRLMGTHNKLLSLGNSTYLEVIAIDPDAPKPDRPRWFGLDDLETSGEPGLITWVVRTDDIHGALKKSKLQHGTIESLHRGIYDWRISLPYNGGMPMDGIAPTIIRWDGDAHPSQLLQDSGVSLINVHAYHPNASELANSLTAIGFEWESARTIVDVSNSRKLQVKIKSPKGMTTFEKLI